jgi:hypothetical protein
MQADFSIECGVDDECLEMPWASEDGSLRYVDLKETPALIADLDETRRYPELAEFLRSANSPHSAFHTAKCDAGFTRQMTLEDEVFGTTGKFGSYVDVLFTSPEIRRSFEQHEAAARSLTTLLQRAPEMQASAEFLVRRCFYAHDSALDGFYITSYVFGYSENEDDARKHWGIALRLVGGALVQLSAEFKSPQNT